LINNGKHQPVDIRLRYPYITGDDSIKVDIPIDRGNGQSNENLSGFWWGHNLVSFDQRGWKCRPSYSLTSSGAVQSVYIGGRGKRFTVAPLKVNGTSVTGGTAISGRANFATFSSATYPNHAIAIPFSGGTPVFVNYSALTGSNITLPAVGTSQTVAEHQNRACIGINNTIYYSEVGDYDNFDPGGVYNYLNLGGDDYITGLYNINGNLYILKENSIWVKIGFNSEFESDSLRLVAQGVGAEIGGSCIAEGMIAFCNASGVYLFGESAKYISEPIENLWRTRYNSSLATIGYWNWKKWLFVNPTTQSYSETFVYDLMKNRWMMFKPLAMLSASSSDEPSLPNFYVATTADLRNYYTVSDVESTIETQLSTAWSGITSPHSIKFLKRVFIYGDNVTSMTVYYRNYFRMTPTSSVVASPSRITVFDENIPFNELSIRLTGNKTMYIDSIAVEVAERWI